jgi:stage V sporulation protein AE
MSRRRVILVTDGDTVAQKAVEEATKNIGGRCISKSAGNPTPRSGTDLVKLIKQAKHDPIVIMVDDRGHAGTGKGEEAMDYIINNPEIDVLGVIAVASNTGHVYGVRVDYSVDRKGRLIESAVDKNGNQKGDKIIIGDTVDVLNNNDVPIIIGIGDPGKMDGCDSIEIGAPIITKAMEEIIKMHDERCEKQP